MDVRGIDRDLVWAREHHSVDLCDYSCVQVRRLAVRVNERLQSPPRSTSTTACATRMATMSAGRGNAALSPGMRAAIHGLSGRADLNGREVQVMMWVDGRARWACRIVAGAAEHILVRPQNLDRCPPRFTELSDDVLLLVLERIPIVDLSLVLSVTSKCVRAAVQKTWNGSEWRWVRQFFSRLTTRAEKQSIIEPCIWHPVWHPQGDLLTLRTIFREDPKWLTESIIESVGSKAASLATCQPDVLRMLLDEFACDVNTRRFDGSTLLIDACMRDRSRSGANIACARMLCEHGADLYAVDDDGDGALYYAHENGNEGCVQVLREFGVRGRPDAAVHTSSDGVGLWGGFRDLLPSHVRAELNQGDYTHWDPSWD